MLALDADTSHHIAQVLRMRSDEQLNLTDGSGNLVTGCLQEVSKKKCTVTETARVFQAREGRRVHLAIAPIKNAGRFEWFIEKAVELGVTSIVPILTARTEKQRLRTDRLQQIAVAAMLQSQQVWLPTISAPIDFDELIARWSDKGMQCLIAHCKDSDRQSLTEYKLAEEVGMLIGPEGDFTDREIEQALVAGFHPTQMGNTRLRTETAGVVSAAWLRLQQSL